MTSIAFMTSNALSKLTCPKTAVGLLIAALLASCNAMQKSGQNFQPQNISPAAAHNLLPSAMVMAPHNFIANRPQKWWKNFGDHALNQLVHTAQTRSFDTRRALTDIQRAEAIVRGARANAKPSLSFDGDLIARTNNSSSQTNGSNLGLSASWDADVFGGIRAQIQSGTASLYGAQALYRDTQRLVTARTVQAYLAYRHIKERSQLTDRNIARLGDNAKRIERLMQGGVNTKLDLRRSENQIYKLQANRSALAIQETAAINALSALTNTPPAMLKHALTQSQSPLIIPSQLPTPDLSLLTRHRPDLRQKQWALVAATHGIDAARAELYPNIALSTRAFFAGQSAGHWPQLGSLSGSFITAIAAPLLGRGRILAGVDGRRAESRRAAIEYENAVLNAVLDIDNSLSRWHHNQERLSFRKAGLASAVEAQELAERLFYAGQSDFTAAVLAEQSRLTAEDNFLVATQDVRTAYVDYVASVIPIW